MITVSGDCGRQRSTHDFGVIELILARIRAGNEISAHSVPTTMCKASLPQLEIARILVQQGRQDRAGREVLDRTIGKRCRESLSVALPALSESRFTVLGLTDGRQKSV